MTAQEFRDKLRTEHGIEEIARALANHMVNEWLNDGPREVKRVLALWIERGLGMPERYPRIDFGSEEELLDYAEMREIVT